MNDNAALHKTLGNIVLEKAPCMVSAIDSSLHIVLTNPGFDDIFGPGEGKLCYAAYKGRDTPCDDCVIVDAFRDGKERICEEEGIDRQGKLISYRVRAVPVPDDQGNVAYVVQISLDTTRLLELELGFKQAERLATVGLTTAGMAHTIKNILAGLDGGVYVVNSGLKRHDEDRIRSGWEMVQRYIEQVEGLVKNLLRYSRVDVPHRDTTDPAELIRDVVQLYETKAALKDVHLESRVEGDVLPIFIDRESIHATLTNLISNALDACVWDPDTDKAHRIRISVRPRNGGGIVLEVDDNGMGISEENQRRIFAAFFTTKGIRGTGIGLLLTKKAVQEHGGSVSFTSTPGEGSIFRIELPVSTPETAGDTPTGTPPEESTPPAPLPPTDSNSTG